MSKQKSFKTMKCRTCNEPVEKVDVAVASVLCWRCTIQLARGTKCDDGTNVFSPESGTVNN